MAEPGDGEIRLVAAPRVEHRGVNGPARLDGHIRAAQPLEQRRRVRPANQYLSERCLVEQRHRAAGGALLDLRPRKPVGLAPAVLDDRFRPDRGKHIDPFPSHLGPETGARLRLAMVGRGAPKRPGRGEFPIRPRHGVMKPEYLAHPVVQPLLVVVERGESPDVHPGHIAGRLALHDPFRQSPAGPTRRGDSHRVEPGRDKEVLHFR